MVSTSLIFFLGGCDLEMLTIRELLEEAAPGAFYDKHLLWGAKASEYKSAIYEYLKNGRIPVLIELENDIELSEKQVIFVDHHGKRAGINKPTSLRQVFDLLELPKEKWSSRYELVAANDRGYIPAMLEAGATKEEIIKVRAADRKAQGITRKEEVEAGKAIEDAEVLAEGMMTVINLPHTHTACVSDPLQTELGGAGYKNLIVFSPRQKQVNFFGSGHLVLALNKKFPGGWFGGALPERGFWGCDKIPPDILEYLIE